MARKGGLGKGLDALIPGEFSSETGSSEKLAPISLIIPNPLQPREKMAEENLLELAQSIKEHGILQPLIVTHDELTGQYTLIAGERQAAGCQIGRSRSGTGDHSHRHQPRTPGACPDRKCPAGRPFAAGNCRSLPSTGGRFSAIP